RARRDRTAVEQQLVARAHVEELEPLAPGGGRGRGFGADSAGPGTFQFVAAPPELAPGVEIRRRASRAILRVERVALRHPEAGLGQLGVCRDQLIDALEAAQRARREAPRLFEQ